MTLPRSPAPTGHVRLTPGRERVLVAEAARGDARARRAFVEAFLPLIDDVLSGYPQRFEYANAAAMATAVVSLIKGCAFQSMIEPHLDVDALLAAAAGFLGVPLSAIHALRDGTSLTAAPMSGAG